MTAPLDELYFEWLYNQVWSSRQRNPHKSYWSLARQLYKTEFVWLIPNDDNRVEDGRDLRYEFIDAKQPDNVNEEWLGLGCSMLEMMIALSRRLAFEAGHDQRWWLHQLLQNLDLDRETDDIQDRLGPGLVSEILDCLNKRRYSSDGTGGLFPLRFPDDDQREVEIWYQMSAYLLENEM